MSAPLLAAGTERPVLLPATFDLLWTGILLTLAVASLAGAVVVGVVVSRVLPAGEGEPPARALARARDTGTGVAAGLAGLLGLLVLPLLLWSAASPAAAPGLVAALALLAVVATRTVLLRGAPPVVRVAGLQTGTEPAPASRSTRAFRAAAVGGAAVVGLGALAWATPSADRLGVPHPLPGTVGVVVLCLVAVWAVRLEHVGSLAPASAAPAVTDGLAVRGRARVERLTGVGLLATGALTAGAVLWPVGVVGVLASLGLLLVPLPPVPLRPDSTVGAAGR